MHTKKRKVALEDGIILFGVGQKSIVKYIVSYNPEKDVYKLNIIGGRGRASGFIVRVKYFFEGDTLYKHGYRMYKHTAALEKKYIVYLVRQTLHNKLGKIKQIMERTHLLAPKKMLAINLLCDNMIRGVAQIDRRVK